MKDWKTTIFGAISALAGFVLFSPEWFPLLAVDISKYILAGGLIAFGVSAKDFRKESS